MVFSAASSGEKMVEVRGYVKRLARGAVITGVGRKFYSIGTKCPKSGDVVDIVLLHSVYIGVGPDL
jgi:hypothetical protein